MAKRSKVYRAYRMCSLLFPVSRPLWGYPKTPNCLRNLWTNHVTSNHSYTPLSEPLINRSRIDGERVGRADTE